MTIALAIASYLAVGLVIGSLFVRTYDPSPPEDGFALCAITFCWAPFAAVWVLVLPFLGLARLLRR